MITVVSLREALLDSAREVFETMVFAALEEVGEEATRPCGASGDSDLSPEGSSGTGNDLGKPETCLLGSITFKGSLEGCLGVCCDEPCAQTIAANMLGLVSTDELSENDVSDAIGEIANMVMGAIKSRIQAEVGTVEVSIPSVVQGRQLRNSLGEGSDLVRVRVNVEEQHIMEFSLLYREGKRT